MQFVNEDEVMSAVIQVPEEIPLKMSGEWWMMELID
jgi:hypothetical protein